MDEELVFYIEGGWHNSTVRLDPSCAYSGKVKGLRSAGFVGLGEGVFVGVVDSLLMVGSFCSLLRGCVIGYDV